MRRLIAIGLAVVMAVGVIGGVSAIAATSSTSATVKTSKNKLGTILVNRRGVTLYLFEKDKNGKSSCSGACAAAWPPLITKGKPKASGGVKASMLKTTKRSNGATQVTYGGHPLYMFIGDKGKPGSTAGEGSKAFGAGWYVVGTNGKKIETSGS